MSQHSQIAIMFASDDNRKSGDDLFCSQSHNANMSDDPDKNGGPNHLRAWMVFRKVKGADLAKALGGNVTAGMVSDLANSNRALSAKWLRRLAPVLRTTPGLLLDHDPAEIDTDLLEIWVSAGLRERQQITGAAKAIIRSGTDG